MPGATLNRENPALVPGAPKAGAGRPLRVAIVIPAFNEEQNIGPLLEFLRSYPIRPSTEVETRAWVDVSGSTDRTRHIVEEMARRWPALVIVDVGRRDGLLQTLNRLLARADGDVIVRLDADVRIEPATLPRMLDRLEADGAGIVGARVVPQASASRFVTGLSRAEFDVHHRVSLRAPKTTLVQLFLGGGRHLRPDAGVEDHALQADVEDSGRPAAYEPRASVTFVPPSSLRDFLLQRARNIQQLRYHRRAGYSAPSTNRMAFVGPAILDSLRSREVSPLWVAAFLATEGLARLAAFGVSRLTTGARFVWQPFVGTKGPSWAGVPVPSLWGADGGIVVETSGAGPHGVERLD